MAESVATLLERRRSTGIVGRREELAELRLLLDDDGPVVALIHGGAGMGKSTLLSAFVTEARAAGCAVPALDGRAFEPTESAFLGELAVAIGAAAPTLAAAADRLGEIGDRVVLAVDTYEALRLIDGWLRQTFVPALRANVRVVLAGRLPPFAAWHVDPAWRGLFRSIEIGALNDRDAQVLLGKLGISEADARPLIRLTAGHPLALTVAAASTRQGPIGGEDGLVPARVMEALVTAYVADLDTTTREALDAASVVRRTTRSLLAEMVPEAAPVDSFDRLRDLPFVQVLHDGLALHEMVQQALSALLQATDPQQHRRLRRAAWRQLRREVADASRSELWRYTADMLYLIENPVLREGFFPSDPHRYVMDDARPGDGLAISHMAERWLPARAAQSVGMWWQRAAQSFRVARDASGDVGAFMIFFERGGVPTAWLEDDPITAAELDHLRTHPIAASRRVLFLPAFVTSAGEKPSGAQAACWLDIKRKYMELRPELHRIYTGVFDIETYWPIFAPLGFQKIGTVEFGDVVYHESILEFGPASVDGWLAGLVGAELGADDDEVLDPANRQLVVDGVRIDLTQLEYGVIQSLMRREGRAVRRSTLLAEAWGYDDPAGSNVVEAVVRSLRRKLGSQGDAIETVRGLGYRINVQRLRANAAGEKDRALA